MLCKVDRVFCSFLLQLVFNFILFVLLTFVLKILCKTLEIYVEYDSCSLISTITQFILDCTDTSNEIYFE